MSAPHSIQQILSIRGDSFEATALELFYYQAEHCAVYKDYLNALKIAPLSIQNTSKIPFLPISFFKSHQVKTKQFQEEQIFTSSGTTGQIPSQNFVRSLADYEACFTKVFRSFYGDEADYHWLALLPSYLQRSGSSLVYMANHLMQPTVSTGSGFWLDNLEELSVRLLQLEASETPTILLGVTYALLDFVEKYPMLLKHTIVMETGGMKGRREELTRNEVHMQLTEAFQTPSIHSEYGMTELMSQAYARSKGVFTAPPWMRCLVRDTTDPLTTVNTGRGALNIIDLANLHSCCFIATEDVVQVHADGTFEVTGRMDHSEQRGCSLLAV